MQNFRIREGSKKNVKVWSLTILRCPPPPPPESHLWSPYCNFFNFFFSARNGTYNIINGFLLKTKSTLLANMQVRSLWKAVRLLFRYNYKLSIIEDVYNVLKNNGVLQ